MESAKLIKNFYTVSTPLLNEPDEMCSYLHRRAAYRFRSIASFSPAPIVWMRRKRRPGKSCMLCVRIEKVSSGWLGWDALAYGGT